MAALQAAAASTTPTDVHIESAHHRPHRRQILLILRRHMGVVDRSTALRAGRGHRHVLHVIDERGGRPLAVTPMRRSRPASRSARMGRTHAFREGGGLTKPRAARGLQLAAQPLDLAAQPIALTLGPFEIEAQSFILVQHLFDRRAPGGHPVGGITHAPVMPESARRYKSDPVINYDPRELECPGSLPRHLGPLRQVITARSPSEVDGRSASGPALRPDGGDGVGSRLRAVSQPPLRRR